MSYKISLENVPEISLGLSGNDAEIIQNVAVILSTFEGSVPLLRDFGISASPIHRPLNIAKSMMYSNIKEAIEKYEPRVTVKAITFNASDSHKKLKPTVEVEITGE